MLLLIAFIVLGVWLLLPPPYYGQWAFRVVAGILLIVAAILELVGVSLQVK